MNGMADPSPHWLHVGSVADVRLGRMREVAAGRTALLLYNLDGVIHATAAICPHHAAWLSQGQISGDAIDCPRHMGRFEITTGRQLRGPACPPLRTYDVRIVDGRIDVKI
jgi:3-phenylpropionate/trans-cinnamate dioxygenase ferredoxin component